MPASPASTIGDLLSRLRSIAPHLATAHDMRQCEALLTAIDPALDPAALVDARLVLAAFLLESRDGHRGDNVARAFGVYRQLLGATHPDTLTEVWQAVVNGMANCLIADPDAQPEAFEAVSGLLDRLAGQLRGGDPERLAVALGTHAQLLQSARTGDRDENQARALALLQASVAALGDGTRHPVRWARVHHNLGCLHASLRLGDRSQNIDDAIGALVVALQWRPRANDPVGRARTLRALASLYPEWSGATTRDHALALAEACVREAEEIAGSDPRATPRPAAWGPLAGTRTALQGDLDDLLGSEPAAARARLAHELARHRRVIEGLSPERERLQWAEWTGGLGRLLTRLAHLDRSAQARDEAYHCLRRAIDAVAVASEPRLARDLYRAIGELGHQHALFEVAYPGYATALSIGNFLFDEVASPDGRRQELVEIRGCAQFAAYAAARIGRTEEAIRLAEAGRTRTLVEAMATNALLAGQAPPAVREALLAASSRVAELEAELRTIEDRDPRAIARQMHRRLADVLGGNPEGLGHRLLDAGASSSPVTEDYLRVTPQLRTARTALRQALLAAREGPAGGRIAPLDAAGIGAVARAIGRPLVYLMSTTWGSVALIVAPDGDLATVWIDEATSDFTRSLLIGPDDGSCQQGARHGDAQALARVIPSVIDALAGAIVQPLASRLIEMGHDRAILVPLGTIGQLPLHAAAPDGLCLGYGASAKALQAALASPSGSGRPALLAVGNPTRTDQAALPLATAEVRAIAAMPNTWRQTSLCLEAEARIQPLLAAAATATHLHFAGHGVFRPSEPMDSALLLADLDRISLADLLTGRVCFPSARLAVLCACRSAHAGDHGLPDEVLGLPTGLLLAGVPGIVGTMWPVEDRAASMFAVRFYQELLGREDPLAAVAAAQRWLRAASAAELAACVDRMRQSLGPGDEAAGKALSRWWRDLASRPPGERPFAAPLCWAAFAYVGT
jgi:hypothetical protein